MKIHFDVNSFATSVREDIVKLSKESKSAPTT